MKEAEMRAAPNNVWVLRAGCFWDRVDACPTAGGSLAGLATGNVRTSPA